ncbi:hypothetical protein PAXRUDRAFT_495605, partial [Paxillus rubicundulus Ve08.2h10]
MKTHHIKARSVLVRRHGWRSFLECFPIPDVDRSADCVFSASHMCRVADISMQTAFVVHELPPDPHSGEMVFAVAGLAQNIKRDVSISFSSTATICMESNGGISCLRTDIMAMPFASSLYIGSSSGRAQGICGAETTSSTSWRSSWNTSRKRLGSAAQKLWRWKMKLSPGNSLPSMLLEVRCIFIRRTSSVD